MNKMTFTGFDGARFEVEETYRCKKATFEKALSGGTDAVYALVYDLKKIKIIAIRGAELFEYTGPASTGRLMLKRHLINGYDVREVK